ncbi:hypothetical protein F5Y12DRAFT_763554 [Xylaria sp. FL1777]|nr:hypothetical protein F5Y12DRAFT_763554 [Xylaria sp. FL1777]
MPTDNAYKVMLGIRRAYEAGRPLYPSNDIEDLSRFINEYNANPTASNTYPALDYIGNQQCWEFSQDQLQTAKLDLSPIQWLITMQLVCSHPEKILTRAFSLKPIQPSKESTGNTLLDRFKNSPNFETIRCPRQIQERFEDNQSEWEGSKYKAEIKTALINALSQCFAHDNQPFTKILVIGAGTLELDMANHLDDGNNNWPSMTQHAFAFDLKKALDDLSSHSPVELVFQDPEYTDVTKEVLRLQKPTIKIVEDDTLDTVFGVDDHTLLFAANCTDFPLKQIVAEYATANPCPQRLPRVIIWEEGVHVTWEGMEKTAIEENLTNSVDSADRIFRDSPRTNSLEELYNKFEFPTPEKGDPDPFATNPRLAIYVRK